MIKFKDLRWKIEIDDDNVCIGCLEEDDTFVWHVLIVDITGKLRLVRNLPDDIGLSVNDEGQINITDYKDKEKKKAMTISENIFAAIIG